MSASLPRVYTHTSPRETLEPILSQLLPYSLPLLRRIQFHFQSPNAVVLSTTDPSAPLPPTSSGPGSRSAPAPFAAIYCDRSRAPETECWLFSTADITPSSDLSPRLLPVDQSSVQRARDELEYQHMLALFAHVESLGRVNHIRPTRADRPGHSPSDLQPSDIMMFGTLHENSLRLLKGLGNRAAGDLSVVEGWSQAGEEQCSAKGNRTQSGVMRGHTLPWLKYIFPPKHDQHADSDSSTLPAGLEWTTPQEADFDLIVARSVIRRTPSTVAMWAGAGVRETRGEFKGALAAWTFISADGSLAALHVEERWRRRGLAKAVTGRLKAGFGRAMATDAKSGKQRLAFEGVGSETWVHSDTGDYNKQAQGLLAAMGGRVEWNCYWGWVDLGRAKEEAEKMAMR